MASIAAAKPERPRGTLSYESHAFGWICAEIVRLVTGRSLPEFLGEELGDDLAGLDFMAAPGAPPAAHTYWLGRASYRLGGVDLPPTFEHANNEISSRRALVPGAGMLTTARALAAFYEMLLAGGVVRSGRRLIREETLRRYIALQTSGIERLSGAYLRLGRGFALGWPLPHVYGWWGSSRCFGHAGGFSCVGFADPDAAVAVAILTNGNRSLPDMVRRFAPLASARAGCERDATSGSCCSRHPLGPLSVHQGVRAPPQRHRQLGADRDAAPGSAIDLGIQPDAVGRIVDARLVAIDAHDETSD